MNILLLWRTNTEEENTSQKLRFKNIDGTQSYFSEEINVYLTINDIDDSFAAVTLDTARSRVKYKSIITRKEKNKMRQYFSKILN